MKSQVIPSGIQRKHGTVAACWNENCIWGMHCYLAVVFSLLFPKSCEGQVRHCGATLPLIPAHGGRGRVSVSLRQPVLHSKVQASQGYIVSETLVLRTERKKLSISRQPDNPWVSTHYIRSQSTSGASSFSLSALIGSQQKCFRGWQDGSVVMRVYCPCRGPELIVGTACMSRGSQLPVTPTPEGQMPLASRSTHIHMHIPTHNLKK